MASILCLAKTSHYGRRPMVLRFSHLFMKRKLAGHPSLGGSNLRKFKANMAPN